MTFYYNFLLSNSSFLYTNLVMIFFFTIKYFASFENLRSDCKIQITIAIYDYICVKKRDGPLSLQLCNEMTIIS